MKKDKMIDLDALETPVKEQSSETTKVTANVGELGLAVSQTAVAPKASRSLAEIYSERQKLIYLIDVSGSMADIVAGAADASMFSWSDSAIKSAKEKAAKAAAKMASYQEAATVAIQAAVEEGMDIQDVPVVEPSQDELKWAELDGLDDEALKVEVVRKNLYHDLWLMPLQDKRDLCSKLGLVKKMASRMIDERLQKYPDADIMCATFTHEVNILPVTSKEAMLLALEGTRPTGGTAIHRAIATIIEACKKRPAKVNLHHIVLVSDGEDGSATSLPDLLPQMKELGVVLDFIYISQPGEQDSYRTAVAETIKEVCIATNGTYTVVTNADEFTTKFIAASQRLMLPPAS